MTLPINQILVGNCLPIMKDWPGKYVDLVLTDPPYGIGNMISGTMSKARLHKTRYDIFEDSEKYVIENVIPAIWQCKLLSYRMIITPGWKCLRHYPQWDSFGTLYFPAACGMQLWGSSDNQPILYYGKPFDIGKRIHKCSYVVTEPPSCDLHPCSKPLGLILEIIEKRSDVNDLIFDPFCGVGTTCVAAKMLGRRYIGIDISPEYCKIAEERLKAVDTGVPVKEARNGQKALFA